VRSPGKKPKPLPPHPGVAGEEKTGGEKTGGERRLPGPGAAASRAGVMGERE